MAVARSLCQPWPLDHPQHISRLTCDAETTRIVYRQRRGIGGIHFEIDLGQAPVDKSLLKQQIGGSTRNAPALGIWFAEHKTAILAPLLGPVDVIEGYLTDRFLERASLFDDEHKVVVTRFVLVVPARMHFPTDDVRIKKPAADVCLVAPGQCHLEIPGLQET